VGELGRPHPDEDHAPEQCRQLNPLHTRDGAQRELTRGLSAGASGP